MSTPSSENKKWNILEKDKVWNKIKKYIYILIFFLFLLVILLIVMITIQGITLRKIIDYTSSLATQ